MTTLEEAKEYCEKYNITGDVYFYRCPYCRSINVSKSEKPPPWCMVCYTWCKHFLTRKEYIKEK